MQTQARLNWLDMDENELAEALSDQPAYRAGQVFSNLHAGRLIDELTSVPKAVRERMKERPLGGAEIIETRESKLDDTKKLLYALGDGNVIEGVLMRYKHGDTLCVSTQVGCRMGCKFCASTIGSLVRSLTAGEILGQILAIERAYGNGERRAVTNVVLMGSGEPMDNYDNVTKFLRLVSAKNGINISLRNVSLSTCGIVPRIRELAQSGLTPTLSLSLHAPTDALRKTIMPVANKYAVDETVEAVRYYVKKTGRRAIIEYALIDGVNDTDECFTQLCALLRGFQCHVNLIPLNPVKENDLKGTAREKAARFAARLEALGVSATVRREMGTDIQGACGQLRRSYLNKQDGDSAEKQPDGGNND